MKSILNKVLIASIAVCLANATQAQMSVTNATPFNSSAHLIQNVFMGSQITAFNYKYNGTTNANVTNQVGYFTGGGNIIE